MLPGLANHRGCVTSLDAGSRRFRDRVSPLKAPSYTKMLTDFEVQDSHVRDEKTTSTVLFYTIPVSIGKNISFSLLIDDKSYLEG